MTLPTEPQLPIIEAFANNNPFLFAIMFFIVFFFAMFAWATAADGAEWWTNTKAWLSLMRSKL